MRNITHQTYCLVLMLCTSCASFDNGLNAVGDALKGDFRSLAKANKTTLDKICRELSQNQVSGSKVIARSIQQFPAIVTKISGEYGDITGFHVGFRDYHKTNHNGHAWTRSANLSNEEKVKNLKVGDRLFISGILSLKNSMINPGKCMLDFDKANFLPITNKSK